MAMAHHLTRAFLLAVLVISATAVVVGAAKVHHVAGGDRGWDPYSHLSAWSSARTFRVGDEISIPDSTAEGAIAEVKSKEEYESCDASNPIRMYTDGLQAIPLEREGIRYFLSTESHNCNNGLKLHVEVQPMMMASGESEALAAADFEEAEGPVVPSASPHHDKVSSFSVLILMFCVSTVMFVCG
ncbi:mavicyanin-like [Neltuma alba]|uniref:mavicyanin-like n=1 Tax=Neltuma alba TaxID=207710 RepID=UPI0010A4952A|nr:mavicyanin-like [Prosopis alba]XP_028755316.1 mavicyanin-like [Prosopis alba]